MSLVLPRPFILSSDNLFFSAVNILLFTEIPLSTSEFPWGSTKAAFTIIVSRGYLGGSICCLELKDVKPGCKSKGQFEFRDVANGSL